MTEPSPAYSQKPLRDTEAAELEFVKLIEEWQLRFELEDYDIVDILRRRLHYLYLKKTEELLNRP